MELLKTQRDTILDFENQINQLKSEKAVSEQQLQESVEASRDMKESLERKAEEAKLRFEGLLGEKEGEIEIMKLEQEQMENEVERMRENEAKMIQKFNSISSQQPETKPIVQTRDVGMIASFQSMTERVAV